jgi:hypothetical protein
MMGICDRNDLKKLLGESVEEESGMRWFLNSEGAKGSKNASVRSGHAKAFSTKFAVRAYR